MILYKHNFNKKGERMKKNNQKGFTIIEVVLVLAIVGLIFMVVFLAIPRLQRAQRDSTRKRHLGDLQAAIDNYASGNRGHLPDDSDFLTVSSHKDKKDSSKTFNVTNFIYDYLLTGDSEFVDPSGLTQAQEDDDRATYQIARCDHADAGVATATEGKCISDGDWKDHKNVIYFRRKSVCGDKENRFKRGSDRKMAIFMKLENGGYHCLSNK